MTSHFRVRAQHFFFFVALLWGAPVAVACSPGSEQKVPQAGTNGYCKQQCQQEFYDSSYSYSGCIFECDPGFDLVGYMACRPVQGANGGGASTAASSSASATAQTAPGLMAINNSMSVAEDMQGVQLNGVEPIGSPADTPPQTAPAAEATQPSPAEEVAKAVEEESKREMELAASGLGSSQAESVSVAAQVSSLGSQRAATVGAIFCAQGANAEAESPGAGSEDVRRCQEHFNAADSLRGLEERSAKKKLSGFSPDPFTLAQDGSVLTLQRFSDTFGISGDDYMGRMLGSRGSLTELGSMASGHLSGEQLGRLLALGEGGSSVAASATSGSGFQVDLGAGRKSALPQDRGAAARDALRKRLLGAKAARAPASLEEEGAETGNSGGKLIGELEHLAPLGAKDLFLAGEEQSELTIFEVVRAKYKSLSPRFGN